MIDSTKEDLTYILTLLSAPSSYSHWRLGTPLVVAIPVTMVHRAQDTRLLIALAKAEKEYAACLTGLLNASQASFAALTTFAASCPPGQAQTVINVVGALNGAEDALMKYAGVVDTWRADLNLLKKSEDEVAGILRDREILYVCAC